MPFSPKRKSLWVLYFVRLCMIEGIMEYAASPVNDSFCTEWGHIRVEVLTTQALSGCVLGSRSRQRWVLGKRELRKKIVLIHPIYSSCGQMISLSLPNIPCLPLNSFSLSLLTYFIIHWQLNFKVMTLVCVTGVDGFVLICNA